MKYLLVLTFLIASANQSVFAQQKWVSLFDGKTLKGWTQRGGEAKYTVSNKEIIGTTVLNTPNSFLCTEQTYGDFILELDFYNDGGFNSGIQFRSKSNPGYRDGVVHGYQMEIDPSERAWSGGIYEEQARGWLYVPMINPLAKTAYRHNDWNHYRIEAIGSTIRTWVNGQPISYFVDTLEEKGFIALQVHSIGTQEEAGKNIRFRNIRIQTGEKLTPSAWDQCPVLNLQLNTLTEQERLQGWKLLFNGQNLQGWRSAFRTEAPTAGWYVERGVLRIEGSNGAESRTFGDLVTRDSFDAFELTFQFRLTEGANSGIKYFVDEKIDAKGGSAIGLEYQLLDNERHPDAKQGVVGNRTLASLYDLIPADMSDPRTKRSIGDWQHGRILVRPDGQVEHWLNGIKVVEYKRGNNIFAALVARSKYAVFSGFGMNRSGPVLLQDHGNTVYFKNLKIKEL